MSANLGNMLSMAAASLYLPFLPLLAGQILLNNFLSDIPAIGLADDKVDPELIERPGRWDMRLIARFMVEFGFLSSLFDLITFAALLWVLSSPPEQFRTAWFLESLLTELVIALVVRTRRPFYQSRPGKLLWSLTLGVAKETGANLRARPVYSSSAKTFSVTFQNLSCFRAITKAGSRNSF